MGLCGSCGAYTTPFPTTPDKPAGEALKACPFCGGKARYDEHLGCYAPFCPKCQSMGAYQDSREIAANLWNTRTPPPPALDDEIVAVLRCIRTYSDDCLLGDDSVSYGDLRALLTRIKERSK